MFRRVLIATDFSRHADRVLECIGDIPGMEEILLLHVITGGSETQEAAAARLLETKKRILAPPGTPLRTLVVQSEYGDIVRSITVTATRERASLIVMGARGRNLLRTLVLGTVSQGVIESGTTDVLVLHFRGEDAPDPGNLEKYCQNILPDPLPGRLLKTHCRCSRIPVPPAPCTGGHPHARAACTSPGREDREPGSAGRRTPGRGKNCAEPAPEKSADHDTGPATRQQRLQHVQRKKTSPLS